VNRVRRTPRRINSERISGTGIISTRLWPASWWFWKSLPFVFNR